MKFLATIVISLLFASPAMAFDFGKCVNSINNQGQRIQGMDPRVRARQCAWWMVTQGKGGNYWKSCMVKGIKKNVKNVKNPEAFVNGMWGRIHSKCK